MRERENFLSGRSAVLATAAPDTFYCISTALNFTILYRLFGEQKMARFYSQGKLVVPFLALFSIPFLFSKIFKLDRKVCSFFLGYSFNASFTESNYFVECELSKGKMNISS